jgi:TetR/AcrR family transcriptional regulator
MATISPLIKQPSRDKILDAAEALFARRGLAGVGLAEVAEAVDLSKATLFHHFRSKAQLHAAVMARILEHIQVAVASAVAQGGPAAERLTHAVDNLIDVLAANPTYARLLLRSLFEDDELTGELPEEVAANAAIARIVAGFTELLKEGIDAGDFHPVSPSHTLQTLIGATVYHFASGDFGQELVGRPLFSSAEVARRKEHVAALMLHGLFANPKHARRTRRNPT